MILLEKRILIRNAKAVVTCDEADHIYYGADLLIEGQRIVKIGKDLPDVFDEALDASEMFVYPGLVNTHHHFFQTFIRNLTSVDYPNMTVPVWLDKIYRIFRLVDGDVIFYSSLTAMADLVKHGCTTAFDHQYCFTKATGKTPVDRQMEAAKLIGLRYHAGRGTNTLPRAEGSTMPEEMVETTDEFLADCDRLIGLYHDPGPFSMSQIVMAPCQPMNCYRDTFTETVKMAREKGVRMHTHLGEGENAIMLERWGKRTLDFCEEIGFIGPDVWLAHAWELTDEEYRRLGMTGTGISHCPTPAVLGGFPILPMKKLMEWNVPVSLGCDGSATNDGSNLLDAIRLAWMMQCWFSKERGGSVSPYDILKMATGGGAKALRRSDIGSLEEGKAADLFMIDAGTLEMAGTHHEPQSVIAHCGMTGSVKLTMVGGRVVFKDGVLTGVDERALAKEGEEVCTRVLREPCKEYFYL